MLGDDALGHDVWFCLSHGGQVDMLTLMYAKCDRPQDGLAFLSQYFTEMVGFAARDRLECQKLELDQLRARGRKLRQAIQAVKSGNTKELGATPAPVEAEAGPGPRQGEVRGDPGRRREPKGPDDPWFNG
eukprot:TRINITY_DN1856_c0_g1_i5.p1 TRINITY_DN1856_c0_g1~~TRINITY_DN1856_c0_g1_i5.p1  ORF type:complete len:130 (-),score=28.51 TRINITY_DN1856_c0_g1_i5:432-821(-)